MVGEELYVSFGGRLVPSPVGRQVHVIHVGHKAGGYVDVAKMHIPGFYLLQMKGIGGGVRGVFGKRFENVEVGLAQIVGEDVQLPVFDQELVDFNVFVAHQFANVEGCHAMIHMQKRVGGCAEHPVDEGDVLDVDA